MVVITTSPQSATPSTDSPSSVACQEDVDLVLLRPCCHLVPLHTEAKLGIIHRDILPLIDKLIAIKAVRHNMKDWKCF